MLRIKIITVFLLFVVSVLARGFSDTVVFTGVNGKLVSEEMADRKKEVDFRSRGRVVITTFNEVDNQWRHQYREKVKELKDGRYQIRARVAGIAEIFVRQYENRPDGKFNFSEYSPEGLLLKTGVTKTKFPLIFDGELVEYYNNKQMKSRSQFKNNELVSNENWFENGKKYIDNIFYSADNEPLYSQGMNGMHSHVRRLLIESGQGVESLSGNMVVGFVVTENGEIDGIRVLRGITPGLNTVVVDAIKTLEGRWVPAKLNGRNVNYFQLFPINFIHRENRFESVEFNGSMLHWDVN